jgi:hypothetical protein
MSFQVLAQAAAPDPAGAFSVFAGVGIVFAIIALLTSIFWIWMLIDCATSAKLDGTQKLVWVLIILFLHFIGALIYLVVARGSRSSASGS